jgi:hypothetical protein
MIATLYVLLFIIRLIGKLDNVSIWYLDNCWNEKTSSNVMEFS